MDQLYLQVDALGTHANDHHCTLSTHMDVQERDMAACF